MEICIMYGVNPILDANVCGILVRAPPVARLCSIDGVHNICRFI
jgi:hypothetical protein